MEQNPNHRFATTQWSLVVEARQRSGPEADAALETMCRAYWFPLYAYARRRGYSPEDATDLTQEFFARLIEKSFLDSADPQRGRFRTFLLTLFQRVLAKQYERSQAEKRGGQATILSLNFVDGETRYSHAPADEETAERIFERQWALTLLSRVVEQLQAEYVARGKTELFYHCRSFLVNPAKSTGYAAAAQALTMTEGAPRVAVHRLRERYRELLRSEVAGTIVDDQTINDELNTLRRSIQNENRSKVCINRLRIRNL